MKEEFLRIYLKYKKFIVPTVLISVSVFILFRIILPQISVISETNRSIAEKNEEIAGLNETLSLLSGLSLSQTESNLSLSTRALPTSKDISLIFSALTKAASVSDVELRDFSLVVGNLYKKEDANVDIEGTPILDVTARFSAVSQNNYVSFSNEIQRTLPLAEIKSIDTTAQLATFKLSFYYKPYDVTRASGSKISPLTQADINLLNQLKEWDK